MNEWILIVPLAAFALLALVFFLVAEYWRYYFRQAVRELHAACMENTHLYAENADLREEVQERRAEVGNLTVELDEAKATPKARPVRVKRVEEVQ